VPSVLLIDDDERSLKLARVVLEEAGWVVMSAPTFEEAILEKSPQLIVIELAKPAPFALVTNIRLAVLDTPIVAVTSLDGPQTEFRALTAGCSGFIRKPIDVTTFATQLLAFIGDRT
jgi:two-component system, cell cycle response regulator DivK